jgi:hypothetical protein
MKGSHGMKPPVAPYPNVDLALLKPMVLDVLKYIKELPWPGDRIREDKMAAILTMARYILDQKEGSASGSDVGELLREIAEQPIEEWEDTVTMSEWWLTADDIAARMRARLKELKYWWEES